MNDIPAPRLTGPTSVPAGERQEDGTFPEGTVHYVVEKRLEVMGNRARQLARNGGRGNGEDSGNSEGGSAEA